MAQKKSTKTTTQRADAAAPAFLCGGCVFAYDCNAEQGRCSHKETEIKLNDPACDHGEKRK